MNRRPPRLAVSAGDARLARPPRLAVSAGDARLARPPLPRVWRQGWVAALIACALVLLAAWRGGGSAAQGAQETPLSTSTPTTVPFLHMPFAGTYGVNSVFDHQFPTYEWDDTIVLYSGAQASAIDGIVDRLPTFRGGYRLPSADAYVYYDGHNGIDYDTGGGTTVLAAAAGEVVFAGSVPSGCDTPLQYVCIEHENGYRTFYLHLEGICVQREQWVEAGDPVGISGNSGCSLGAHLHFAVDRDRRYTDPYGWQPEEQPDPLIRYGGGQATWLWLPDVDPLPSGTLTEPPAETWANGDITLRFAPDAGSPPIARVTFLAYHRDAWHAIGLDEDGADGWSTTWDTRDAPEGEVWLHAWLTGADGRVSKGSPIRTDVIVDRQPPIGYLVGLEPGTTAGGRLWLYAASYDAAWEMRGRSTGQTEAGASTGQCDEGCGTARVTMLVRESGTGAWRAIGEAAWLHTTNWLLEWDADLEDGARIDVAAQLTDRAGNAFTTQPVTGIAIDRQMPAGMVIRPLSGLPFAGPLDLAFAPFPGSAPVSGVTFRVWYDGAWHEVGEAERGWALSWDPAAVADQRRLRVQAIARDALGRANSALPQSTDLTLDRTPPEVRLTRPRTEGVARPDVSLKASAWDAGSGVAQVAFYVDQGAGWVHLGDDDDGGDGWWLSWEAPSERDGLAAFGARARDWAGHETWAEEQVDVALDRAPPLGTVAWPTIGARLGGTVTITLDVTDTLSGLDRAIFYARYDERWHHLGADDAHEDGLSLAWDTTPLTGRRDVTLTAWVYDRAGNHAELAHVAGLSIAVPPSPPTPTRIPLPAPSATPTPAVPATAPVGAAPAAPTSAPVDTATPSPTALPRTAQPIEMATEPAPVPSAPSPIALVPRAFWYLVAGGGAIGLALLIHGIRALRAGRR
ncbi:MAG: M23 family metallopeptidase [Anaerolineae bacterium]|nr:M23 family metallopeptidase [Anaerolineae bacterium]